MDRIFAVCTSAKAVSGTYRAVVWACAPYPAFPKHLLFLTDPTHVPLCSGSGPWHQRGAASLWERALLRHRWVHHDSHQGDTGHRDTASKVSTFLGSFLDPHKLNKEYSMRFLRGQLQENVRCRKTSGAEQFVVWYIVRITCFFNWTLIWINWIINFSSV